ncbi:STAS domain-containing protein [Embleya scabrispora]|uniref:STAS domain-containing protein n=1 Tax=Embleya scabrispora TaxID=159449 RepID=UPI000A30F89A|nr:STAS domain-containing protein [Embleya scabrispora]MYS86109.1 STAS domain-containing protein [Streptomyces sp. SID5474]
MAPRRPATRHPSHPPGRPRTRRTDRPETAPKHLRIRVSVAGDRVLLRIGGELDIDTGPHLRRALDIALDTGAHRVDVDMRTLTFCDSTGLHALLYARARAQETGTRFGLAPGDRLGRLLEVTDTAHLFIPLAFP